MLLYMHFIYFSSLFCYFVAAKNEDYKGYKVYNIELKTVLQQEKIRILKSDLIDFWRFPNYKYGVMGQVMMPPSHFSWFEEKLEELGINRDVYIEDVYQYLSEVENRTSLSRNVEEEYYFDVNKYHRYDNILTYLRKLEQESADSLSKVELVEYGVTAENRPLVYLRISRGANDNNSPERPIIVIEGATNPRDWVTIPAALNIVENLLKESRFLENLEWIIIPVLNPDGYEYTHTNLRLWQKSRSTNSNMGHICPGVNINRNFDYDWQNFDASSSPCSHVYAGVEPFSEIESRMIQDIINKNAPRVKLYMSLQNNGGYISIPWYYEKAASGMFRQQHLLGLEMVKTMNNAYNLDVGSVIFDRISGTSVDYVRSKAVLYTYNFDVVQRGNGVIIPEEDISDIVEDVWKATAVAAEEIIRLYITNYFVFFYTKPFYSSLFSQHLF